MRASDIVRGLVELRDEKEKKLLKQQLRESGARGKFKTVSKLINQINALTFSIETTRRDYTFQLDENGN